VELYKVPGIAETLDWAEALVTLNAQELELPVIQDTLGVLLKYQDDIDAVSKGQLQGILEQVRARLQAQGQEATAQKAADEFSTSPAHS
jgi:hypothetical protein